MEGSWRKWWQLCRVVSACLLLLSPASSAFVASPGLSAPSHCLPAPRNLLHSPDFHWSHGAPFILRCQHVCGAELPSPGSDLVLPVPRVAHGGCPASLVAPCGSPWRWHSAFALTLPWSRASDAITHKWCHQINLGKD